MRWGGRVASTEEMRYAYIILDGNHEGNIVWET
jgi:hypothetical protein